MLCLFGVAGSYARMALKVSNYNSLERETQLLRNRYDNLQKQVQTTNQQLASLQVLASEVSSAYGIRNQIAGSPDLIGEAPLIPSMGETLAEEYANYLQYDELHAAAAGPEIFSAAAMRTYAARPLARNRPSDGQGGFGERTAIPFPGEGARHTGIDISSPRWVLP